MKKLFSVRTIILAGSFLLQLGAFCFQSRGAAGDVDLSFDAGSSVTNPVSVVVVQPDGRVLIGGPFTFINGTNHYASARLNANGSLDDTFIPNSFDPDLTHVYGGPPSYAEVAAVAVQPDGKVLVGGFVALICTPDGGDGCQSFFASFVTRLNPNGSRDTSFTPFFGPPELAVEQMPQVKTVALQPDGKIVVGYVGYGFVSGIVRLNTNGIRDTNFNTSVAYPGVYSVVVQSDGKVLIGGEFHTVNGTNRNGVARLNSDGSLDITFNPAVGGYPLALQPDGRVLVGGFARLNADGSLDSSFNPGAGANGFVRSLALQPDGKVIVGGAFTSMKGVARPYVARLYGDSVPSLNIARSNALVIVSWPAGSTGFQLQQNTNLTTTHWITPPETITDNGTTRFIIVSPAPGNRFFRLFKP